MVLEATEVLGEEDNEKIMTVRIDNMIDKIDRVVNIKKRGRVMEIIEKMMAVIEEDNSINNRIEVSKLNTMNLT